MWVFFDKDNLYVSAKLWESDPTRRVATEMRRDAQAMYGNDHFGVSFDGFYDRRNGYSMYVNSQGGMVDWSINNEQPNNNWNGIWDVRTGTFEHGWTAEIRFPFRSFRFREGGHVWGMNSVRLTDSGPRFVLRRDVQRGHVARTRGTVRSDLCRAHGLVESRRRPVGHCGYEPHQRAPPTLSSRMFVSALIQYQSRTSNVSSNARFRWEYRPGSDLFLVYSDGRTTLNQGFPDVENRSVVVKATRLFRW